MEVLHPRLAMHAGLEGMEIARAFIFWRVTIEFLRCGGHRKHGQIVYSPDMSLTAGVQLLT
jgi:hypothetical protein